MKNGCDAVWCGCLWCDGVVGCWVGTWLCAYVVCAVLICKMKWGEAVWIRAEQRFGWLCLDVAKAAWQTHSHAQGQTHIHILTLTLTHADRHALYLCRFISLCASLCMYHTFIHTYVCMFVSVHVGVWARWVQREACVAVGVASTSASASALAA